MRFLRKREVSYDNKGQVALALDGIERLTPYTIVDGGIGSTRLALQQIIGENPPELSCYPTPLQPFLGRSVVQTIFERAWEDLACADIKQPVVKPVEPKRFQLRALPPQKELDDRFESGEIDPKCPVWVAEYVERIAEWRFFVAFNTELGWTCYAHDGSGLVFPQARSMALFSRWLELTMPQKGQEIVKNLYTRKT